MPELWQGNEGKSISLVKTYKPLPRGKMSRATSHGKNKLRKHSNTLLAVIIITVVVDVTAFSVVFVISRAAQL